MNDFEPLLRQAPPAAQAVLRGLAAAQHRHRLFPAPSPTAPPAPVVVAVSGGADSICLLHALYRYRSVLGVDLHVAHLDHALRPTSAEDADFTRQQAAALGLPFYTARLVPGQLSGRPGGIEAAAREARYAFLYDVACRVGGTGNPAIVAVAHHQDDQAETVLMNFLRGSGPAGLAGMAWAARLPHPGPASVRLVRPLLGVSRAAIRAYLAAYDLPWREDATNQETSYLRNRVRHTLLPRLQEMIQEINPTFAETLARTADLFAAEVERAGRWDRAALAAATVEADLTGQPPARLVLNLDRLAAFDLATRRGVLRLALAELGVNLREAGFETINRLLDEAMPNAGGPHPLLDDLVWTALPATADHPRRLSLHRREVLPIRPPHPHLDGWLDRLPLPIPDTGALVIGEWQLTSSLGPPSMLPPTWRSRGDPWRAFLDADRARDLVLATTRPGLQIAPLGLEGRRRSVGDLFTDQKVPPALRPVWPLVQDNASGEVIWVCGLAVSHTARITPQTRCVRTLAWRPVDDSLTKLSGPNEHSDVRSGVREESQCAPASNP